MSVYGSEDPDPFKYPTDPERWYILIITLLELIHIISSILCRVHTDYLFSCLNTYPLYISSFQSEYIQYFLFIQFLCRIDKVHITYLFQLPRSLWKTFTYSSRIHFSASFIWGTAFFYGGSFFVCHIPLLTGSVPRVLFFSQMLVMLCQGE
jgi:hypothetical protein